MIRLAMVPAALWATTAAAQVVVTPEWLVQHRSDPGLVVLHAAMSREGYDQGHVPGSRFISAMGFHSHGTELPPADRLARELGAAGVSNRSRVVIVGDPMSAALVFVALDYLGHGDQTSVVDGGIEGWRAAGQATSTDSAVSAPAVFRPRVRTDLIVSAEWVDRHRSRPGFRLLDARSQPEYAGTTDQEPLPRAGHIPGGVLLDWRDTFEGESNRLRPADQLRRLFEQAGAARSDTVVAYCTVGMRASHLYLVARHLGYPARIYLGSMADWSRRPALPVVTGTAPGSDR